jgi:hypothetical protein
VFFIVSLIKISLKVIDFCYFVVQTKLKQMKRKVLSNESVFFVACLMEWKITASDTKWCLELNMNEDRFLFNSLFEKLISAQKSLKI